VSAHRTDCVIGDGDRLVFNSKNPSDHGLRVVGLQEAAQALDEGADTD
jgi:hypothetical protein